MICVAARRLVTPSGVLEPGWLEVDGGRITRVVAGEVAGGVRCRRVDVLTPGLVDVHVHGGNGAEFADPDHAAVRAAVAHHRRRGTTTVCTSLMSAPLPQMESQVERLTDLVEEGVVAGIHLEGPWLSPRRAGAHSPATLRAPDVGEVCNLLTLGRGSVRMVTLAPELEGGLEAVRMIVDHGAVAALGHTDADYDTARAALDAGATHATHLGNGMRPIHHRDPGVVLAVLERDGVTLELINDGVHLHDAVTAGVIRQVGSHRVVLISDGSAASGLPDGHYTLGCGDVVVEAGAVRLSGHGSLAGSAATLADNLRRAVVALGVPLADAIAMASTVPAALLGLSQVGRLEAGALADLVAFDDDLTVSSVMVRGAWL
jgi:N-acetylglucosamine-6-phosphate deacetylase